VELDFSPESRVAQQADVVSPRQGVVASSHEETGQGSVLSNASIGSYGSGAIQLEHVTTNPDAGGIPQHSVMSADAHNEDTVIV